MRRKVLRERTLRLRFRYFPQAPPAPQWAFSRFLSWRVVIGIALICAVLLSVGCALDPETAKRKYLENGNKYFERGRFREASIMYRSALRKDRRYGEAWYRLALAELKLNRASNAVHALRRAVELQPENEDAKERLADSYLISFTSSPSKRGEIAREIRKLTGALLQRNPNSFDALRILGQLALLERDYATALAELETAERRKPWDPNVGLALCQALTALNQFQRCESHANELIRRHPSFEPAYTLLYREYMSRGRLEDASQVLEKLAANLFRNPANTIKLAQHYYVNGRPDLAARTLDRLLANRLLFPNARRQVAEFYLQFSDFQPALEHLQAGARAAKGAEKLEYERRIVEVLLAQGNTAEAGRRLSELLKANPSDPDLLADKASMTLSSGTPSQVEAELRRLEDLVKRNPKNPALRYQLGRACWDRGKTDLAIEQFKEAARLNRFFAAPRLALAQLYLNQRDPAAALKLAEEVVDVVPGEPSARWLYAAALRGVGKRAQALEQLRMVVNQYPNVSESWLRLGRMEQEERNTQAAEQAFRACFERTRAPACLAAQAEVVQQGKGSEAALTLLQNEMKSRPSDRTLKLAVAAALQKQKRYAQARPIYEDLVAADPGSASLRLGLGSTLFAMGDAAAALPHLQAAVRLDPTNPFALHYLSVTLISLGRSKEALEACEALLKLRPEDPVALNNAAFLLTETGGDLDRALTFAQRAVRAMPAQQDFSDTLGLVYLKRGPAAKAAEIYRGLVASHPENSLYRYRLALALFQQGDRDSARAEAETALRRNPPSQDSIRLRELLGKLQ